MAKPMGGFTKNLPLGKAVTANISKTLVPGSRLTCADNSGAKEVEIISVRGYKGRLNRYPKAGVADLVIASVKKGKPEMRKQVVMAVVIRQKHPYRRYNGTRVRFHDNAAVVINEEGFPKGTEIKGAVAREATEKWNKISSIASIVV
jgi:large subunit ribosomal protein L14